MAGAITDEASMAVVTTVVVMAITAGTDLIAEASEVMVGSTAGAVSMVATGDFMEETASMVVMADFVEEEVSMAVVENPMAARFKVAVEATEVVVDFMAAVEATEAGITNCRES
jgi:hypothetical protein